MSSEQPLQSKGIHKVGATPCLYQSERAKGEEDSHTWQRTRWFTLRAERSKTEELFPTVTAGNEITIKNTSRSIVSQRGFLKFFW